MAQAVPVGILADSEEDLTDSVLDPGEIHPSVRGGAVRVERVRRNSLQGQASPSEMRSTQQGFPKDAST